VINPVTNIYLVAGPFLAVHLCLRYYFNYDKRFHQRRLFHRQTGKTAKVSLATRTGDLCHAFELLHRRSSRFVGSRLGELQRAKSRRRGS